MDSTFDGSSMEARDAKISVVIPAWNSAHFLPRSLGSVFAQTLRPREVIVVDDGSTDSTAATAEKLGAKVIRQANGGSAAARNAGMAAADGDWIALLDADDWWEPEKLARQASLIRPGLVLIYTGVKYHGSDGRCSAVAALDPRAVRDRLRYRNPIVTSSVLVDRSAMLELGGFRETLQTCEDWEMWLRLANCGSVDAVADPLTNYYVQAESLSSAPERMLNGLAAILEPVLLADQRGWPRWAWRRRIWASQLLSAALIARDNYRPGEIRYLVRSLRAWPSPFWLPRRWACLAVSLKNALAQARNRRPQPDLAREESTARYNQESSAR